MKFVQPNLDSNEFALYIVKRYKIQTGVIKGKTEKEDIPIYEEGYSYIPLTFFDGTYSSPFATFNENLQEKENSQFTLTFSLAKYVNGEENPFFKMLKEGRYVKLCLSDKTIDLIIKSQSPKVNKDNVIITYTCQDKFSYELSKQSIDFSFDDGPKDIKNLADTILVKANLDNRWQIESTLNVGYYPDFPNKLDLETSKEPTTMVASLQVSNTTCFNALVELATLFNANISITYSDNISKPNIINFINKDSFKFKGLRLREDINTTNLNLSTNADDFCSIMKVSGGEDSNGQIVSLMPEMPIDLKVYILETYKGGLLEEYHRWWKEEDLEKEEDLKNFYFNKWYNNDMKVNVDEFKKDFLDVRKGYAYYGKNNEQPIDVASLFGSSKLTEINEYFDFLNKVPAVTLLYNFDYYHNNGLMDTPIYNEINNFFKYNVRNQNLLIEAVASQYYTLTNAYDKAFEVIEDYAAGNCAEIDYYNTTVYDKYKNIKSDSSDYETFSAIIEKMSNSYASNIMNILKTMLDKQTIESIYSLYGNNLGLSTAIDELYSKFYDKLQEYDTVNSKRTALLESKRSLAGNYTGDEGYVPTKGSEGYKVIGDIASDYQSIEYYLRDAENLRSVYTDYCVLKQDVSNALYYIGDFRDVDKLKDTIAKLADAVFPLYEDGGYDTSAGITLLEGFVNSDDTEQIKNNLFSKLEIKFGQLPLKQTNLGLYGEIGLWLEIWKKYISGKKTIKNRNIAELYSDLKNQLSPMWRDFYKNYQDYVVEKTFSDSDQLTSSGLLSSALTEFSKSIEPKITFSATVIDNDLVANLYDKKIQIGDILRYNNKDLFYTYSDELEIEVAPYPTNWTVGDTNPFESSNMNNSLAALHNHFDQSFWEINVNIIKVTKLENGNYLMKVKYNDSNTAWKNMTTYDKWIATNHFDCIIIYNWIKNKDGEYERGGTPYFPIIRRNPILKNKEVELMVTGISSNLRGNTSQLTIDDNRYTKNILKRLVRNIGGI